MRELALLTPSGPNPSQAPGRPQADSGFDELLSQPATANAPATSASPPRQAPDTLPPGGEASAAPAQGGLPRPERETPASRARGRRPDAHVAASEDEPQEKRRRSKSLLPGDGAPLHPHFAHGPQPTRAAQAAGAAQLKGATPGGLHGAATKVTPPGNEPSRKPSAPETGESPSHRSEATPLTPQPSQPTTATPLVEVAAPPPLPAPVAMAALDLPSLHLSILPNVARLSVSTEEGDVRVQVKVKDSVANLRVEGAGATAFQRAPDELRVLLAQAGLSLGSFEMGQGGGQQQERQEHVTPFEPEASAGFVTPKAPEVNGTEGEKTHSRHVRVRA